MEIETLTLAKKQTKDMENLLIQHMKPLTWSSSTLHSHREKRLRKLLAYAKQHSPWYQKILAKINPETFTEERLIELPVLTKNTLMENWDAIVTNSKLTLSLVESHLEKIRAENQFSYLLDRYRLLVTSGSSGRRGIFIYDWDEWNTYYLMFKRYRFYNHKRTASLLSPLEKEIVIAAVVGTNPIHSIYSLEQSYKTRNTRTIHFPITALMAEIIEGLNQTQPDVLLGSASTIHKLSQDALEKRLCISPKVISVYGEPFYPPVRKAIERIWPTAGIFNTLGTSEGMSASYCCANSKVMHLNDDLCITEPIGITGNIAPKNTLSNRVYITNLFNFTLPLIRYEILDELLFLDKMCACGNPFQLIDEPTNRPDFDFIYNDTIFVNHVVFAYPLLAEKHIKEYQVKQTVKGADILLLTTGEIDFQKLQAALQHNLHQLGMVNPEIHFSTVTNFDYPPSGKLRRFIPL